MSRLRFINTAPASAPASGKTEVFVDTDKKLKSKDDAGLLRSFPASGEIVDADVASGAALGYRKQSHWDTVVDLSTTANFTFSGLDGNADYGYEFMLIARANVSGADRDLFFRPNNDSTGSGRYVFAATGEYLSAGTTPTTWGEGDGTHSWAKVGQTHFNSDGTIMIKGTWQSFLFSGQYRSWTGTSHFIRNTGGDPLVKLYGATWSDSTNNMTSLVFGISAGSLDGKAFLRRVI